MSGVVRGLGVIGLIMGSLGLTGCTQRSGTTLGPTVAHDVSGTATESTTSSQPGTTGTSTTTTNLPTAQPGTGTTLTAGQAFDHVIVTTSITPAEGAQITTSNLIVKGTIISPVWGTWEYNVVGPNPIKYYQLLILAGQPSTGDYWSWNGTAWMPGGSGELTEGGDVFYGYPPNNPPDISQGINTSRVTFEETVSVPPPAGFNQISVELMIFTRHRARNGGEGDFMSFRQIFWTPVSAAGAF